MKDNQKILFMSDYPVSDINPVRINRSHIRNDDRDYDYTSKKTLLDRSIVTPIANHQNTKLVNTGEYGYFLKNSPFYNDTLMYYDSNHLNYYGSSKYEEITGEKFKEYLDWWLNTNKSQK